MSEPIGVGDWVECVETRGGNVPLVIGAIYEIAAVRAFQWKCDGCSNAECHRTGLRLTSVDSSRPGYPGGWICSRRFRPIYRPKASLIATLKQPAPELGREVETAGSTGRRT